MADHYDEETLIRVAESAIEVDDAHLRECDDCRGAVEQYRDMLFCMEDESAWDHRPIDDTPNPQTIATLRSFVEEMHREDAEAEPLVAELLAGNREEWMPRLMADAKYRTAGVVRKLIAATDALVDTSVTEYSTAATLAVDIAERLDPDAPTTASLQAAAWRELAFARYLSGEVDAAALAESESRRRIARVDTSGFETARLDVLLATIESRCEKTDSAIDRAAACADQFDEFGESKRLVGAMWLKANILAEKRAFRAAFDVAEGIRVRFNTSLDEYDRAGILLNQGYYLREAGDFVPALERLQEAAFIFDAIGARSPAARVAFNAAVVLYTAGQTEAASVRLETSIDELEAVGLTGVSTLATLYLAEIRLEQQRYDDVELLCRKALQQVHASAVAYRERALVALALLREVAEHRRASRSIIQHVRNYVARLPLEPTLEFAQVPLPTDINLG